MNRIASFAAVVALLAIGLYFYQTQTRSGDGTGQNVTPVNHVAADDGGANCCSADSAESASCCSHGTAEVATGSTANAGSCCSEGGDCAQLGETEVVSSCPNCAAKAAEVAAAAKTTCPCSGAAANTAGAEASVSTVADHAKGECTGDCGSNCCQEKTSETEVAKTSGEKPSDK